MGQKTILVILVAMLTVVCSCKKDKDDTTTSTPTTYPNYSMLKVGNYWIYQQFKVDSLGNATPTAVFDSCYVEKDTVIENQTYYKINRPGFYSQWNPNEYFRDSLHYIVSFGGYLEFSSVDFTTIFDTQYILGPQNDTITKKVRKMDGLAQTVTVPAGTFTTLDSKLTCYMFPGYSFNGNIRCIHRRYAKNIGLVVETLPFFLSEPTYTERRLVRYHLN